MMGEKSVELAIKTQKKEEITKHYYTPFTAVAKDNVDNRQNWAE